MEYYKIETNDKWKIINLNNWNHVKKKK